MKLNLLFKRIPDNESNRKLIVSSLAPLDQELNVTSARASIEKAVESTQTYHASVHLEVPGPDIKVSAKDYTLAAAWRKVLTAIRREVDRRAAHRRSRHSADHGRALRRSGPTAARA